MTKEASNSIVTSCAVEAGGSGTVVNVLGAIGTGPAVDANARISTVSVGTSGSVFAYARSKGALINVLVAVRTRERGGALASIGVDAIDARSSILTQMARTVVYILLAI